MSNRDSLGFGDLIPQDVVEIFAQEKHSKRGRKKRSHSLGRALGWLKGRKRKDLRVNGQSLGLGPALDLALDGHPAGHQGGHKGGQKSGKQSHPHGNSHAVPKRNDDDKTPAPPLLQENVFIEASRPKYLEDLHTEALEGLKMMQQEETNNGVVYQDNESTISAMTVQTEGDGEGFMTDSTIADTSSVVSVQSSVSTRSSRSGLTRQGSTFRPLNSGKKSEKAKTRRRHRKTVGGIPQHVQRELGLDRVGWTASSKLEEEQLYNGETDDSMTTDEPQLAAESQKEASPSFRATRVIQPIRKHQDQQLFATHASHRDDLALLHRLGPDLSGGQRPRSLAVPWMTTANSLQPEPPSPVMSMSPQAAYMSKIIPNAVLPPSIEVVEISRGRSRSSVRTVSKTSLLLSSPAPSRASTRSTSSRASNITSASQYNASHLSDSSCWSNSESSETLVSDSSTISSSSTPRQKRSQDGDASGKEDKVSVHSSISKASTCTSNGKLISKGGKTKNEGPFVRSLSVMKPKRAPPPPNRSYSLHNKLKRRSRDLAEVRTNSGESSLHNVSVSGEENEKNKPGPSPVSLRIMDSPDYNADTSSLDDSTGSGSFSPFKSQLQAVKTEEAAKVEESKDATKEKQEPLQENKLSKMISPSSGYSSQDCTSPQLSKPPHSSSPRHKRGILAKLQRLFPGSTHAGSAPSPLTEPEASENTKSTADASVDTVSVSPSVRALKELFNIPPPPKVHAPPPPPPEVWAHNKRTFELLLGPPAPDNTYAIIKKNPKDRRQQRQSPSASAEGSVKTKKVQESGFLNVEILKENNERLVEQNDLKGSSKVTEKDETVRVSERLNGMLAKAVEKRGEKLAAMKEEESKKTSTQATEGKTNTDTLPTISLVRISPSPSSPPVQAVASPESSWPPPPPAIDQVGPLLNGPDDIDFPCPPPPLFYEERLVMPMQVPPEKSIPGTANTEQVNSACTTTSVVPVVKTDCVNVTTEAETLKTSSSQGIAPPPLNIPPPPPYTAPPPPGKEVSPPKSKEVNLSPPKEFSPPPPDEIAPLPPKEVCPPPPEEVSPLLPKEVSPLPPGEVSPLPPKQVSPVPPGKVSPLPPKEVYPVPPEEKSPPPPMKVSPGMPKESPSPLEQVIPPPVTGVSPTLVNVVSPPPVKEVSPPLVIKDSVLPAEEFAPTSCQKNVPQTLEEASPESKLPQPQSISPPLPTEPVTSLQSQPQSTEQKIDVPFESIPSESETNPVSCTSILTPPQSIPPPPPSEFLPQSQVPSQNTVGPATQEASPSLPDEASIPPALETTPPPLANIPSPPPLPAQDLASIELSPPGTENQSPELLSAPVVQEEPTPIVTPSLLQLVKLRSVNSSPEPPKVQEQAQVTMMTEQPNNQVPGPSANGEAPQKPIRRSLILTSPTSTSPPVTIPSEPTLPKSQSAVISIASSATVLSPMPKKPPTAMTTSPSMNLQEAIRLRTAARSKDSPASRLSLHSPTSPVDSRKSPSSTASFIFSKSSNKAVIETKPTVEATETSQNNPDVSSVTKEVKMPPPVAKKPKTKAKEMETNEEAEQTAGQEAQPESVGDKTNMTAAGSVEGGAT
ncbi:uncharacterized protein KIAA1522 homolog [Scomber scombrus]|uniref:uncharacterized protein KIAA1522 homolog n=1 Tax=Scomber scombrus TaxID=13677 RepID=UPI002DDAECD4|nr:uncharacterized protein KIAA1522 homolog [Scomber scombrus]